MGGSGVQSRGDPMRFGVTQVASLFRRWVLLLGLVGVAMGAASMTCEGGTAPTRDLQSDTWVATDALGRTLPGYDECGPPRKGKTVGIFYFLWLGAHGTGLYDNSKILAANPGNPQWGPVNAFHWWGEPYMGYYLSNDEFVIRKHAQMLTDAGVDVVIFDVTNAFTYDDTVLTLCRVFEDIRRTGRTTPQIAFLANSDSAKTVKHLYDVFYSRNLYPALWFRWKGKPLLMAPEEGLNDQIRAFFTIRRSWAWTDPKGWFGDGKDKWPWIDNYPQTPSWHDSPNKPEQISVCVAQHPVSNIGRSFHDGKEPPPDQIAPEKGLCFAEQWRRALQVDPEFVFITGWNEWVAMRFVSQGGPLFVGKPLKPGESYFVDEYNQEYSRDIEPMRGGHGDNYYYQMVANIRRYKGVRPPPKPSGPKTIRIDVGFEQWRDVRPEFLDDIGDTVHRNHPGWDDLTYVNNTGRNDFELLKVARDARNLYFYARTHQAITPPTGDNWMLLLLNTDGNPHTGWNGYDFIVNRVRKGSSVAVVERNVGGKWSWEAVGTARIRVEGRELQLAVSRAVLGVPASKGPLRIAFKWADGVPANGDIMEFMDKGDVAPNGRFSYLYQE